MLAYIRKVFEMQSTVKIPKSGASRLSDDVWMIGEALNRHYKTGNIRAAIESAIRITADRMAEQDANFAKLLEQVKSEGVESD